MPSVVHRVDKGGRFDGAAGSGFVPFAGPVGDDAFGPLILLASLKTVDGARVGSGELLLAPVGLGSEYGIPVAQWDRPQRGFLVANLPVPSLAGMGGGLRGLGLMLRTAVLEAAATFTCWWTLAPTLASARRGPTTIVLFPNTDPLEGGSADVVSLAAAATV